MRTPIRHESRFVAHATAAKALTKRGDTASSSSASSPSSSLLVTLALGESLLAPPASLKLFRAAVFLGGSAWVVVDVLEKDPDGSIKLYWPMSWLEDGSSETVSANVGKHYLKNDPNGPPTSLF